MITFNAGRTGTVHRGVWNATTQYSILDTAIYTDGVLYLNSFNGVTPVGMVPTNTTYWKVYVPNTAFSVDTELTALDSRVTDLEVIATDLQTSMASAENKINLLLATPTRITLPINSGITYSNNRCWYCKTANNMVIVYMAFDSILLSTNPITIGELPSGYWPKENLDAVQHYIQAGYATTATRMTVSANGEISIRGAAGGTITSTNATITYPAA